MRTYLNTHVQATDGTAESVTLSGQANGIIVHATKAAYLNAEGDDAAASSAFYVPAGVIVDIPVPLITGAASQKVSVIQVASAGSVTIVEYQDL